LPLVYSAALRQTGNPDLAEDVTRVVFILLARKSGKLSPKTILAEWLFRTTRRTVTKKLRTKRRGEPKSFNLQNSQTADVWCRVVPFVDESFAELGKAQRSAVLLHYLQNKRLGEVGQALGISEDAAQRTITRASRKLREFLLRRGTEIPLAALPGLLMTHGAQAAPSHLEASVTAAALGKMTVSSSVYALVQGEAREPIWPKVKAVIWRTAAIAGIGFLLVYFWPHRARPDPSAYSFATTIVIRPPYVAPPPSPKVIAREIAFAAPSTNVVQRTNMPPSPARRTAVVRSQPAATNINLVPVETATVVIAVVPETSNLVELAAVSDQGSEPQPPLWSAYYPAGYVPVPAQNLVWFGGGLGPYYGTNVTPWATAQRAAAAAPARSAPPAAQKRR
jgi:RNA polymerase sigma factor (sigma-70 family)